MNYIVSTTINAPTPAMRRFAEMPGWRLVVAGDLKTPHEAWKDIDADYLSPDDQDAIDPTLSELIGWKCIQRRGMAVVHAMRNGAELIATVDDDNLPNDLWGKDIIAGQRVSLREYECDLPAFDPLSGTGYQHLWHRGFPIQWLAKRGANRTTVTETDIDVQAMLWDGDPDIDAICRMEHSPICEFDTVQPYTANKPMPFNSQNTIITAKAARDWFCFPGIGRMDDIWGGYIAQARGHRVAFTAATVVQERIGHDITRNFEAEIIGYTKTHELIQALATDPEAWRRFVPERSGEAFDRYQELVK